MRIKNQIIYENETVQLLTKIAVDINIKTGEISFTLPDFGVTDKETMIEPSIWELYKMILFRAVKYGELSNSDTDSQMIRLSQRYQENKIGWFQEFLSIYSGFGLFQGNA